MRKIILCIAMLALGGCAGDSVGGNPYSQAAAIKGQGGVYKIGNPYQILGQYYVPAEDYQYSEVGMASWYGEDFHAKKTANGEDYDMNTLTAAHRTLPLPSIVKVTNLENGRSLVLRVNDRGPFARNRIIDISKRGAQLLGFIDGGTAKVRVEVLEKESKELKAALLGQPADPVSAPTVGVAVGSLDEPVADAPENVDKTYAYEDRNYLIGAENDYPKSAAWAGSAAGTRGGVYVQTGSFTKPLSADRTRDKLKKLGNPQVSQTMVDGQRFYRVRFGPFATEREAEMLLDKVKNYGVYDAKIIHD